MRSSSNAFQRRQTSDIARKSEKLTPKLSRLINSFIVQRKCIFKVLVGNPSFLITIIVLHEQSDKNVTTLFK